jgi:hypothetical protein
LKVQEQSFVFVAQYLTVMGRTRLLVSLAANILKMASIDRSPSVAGSLRSKKI